MATVYPFVSGSIFAMRRPCSSMFFRTSAESGIETLVYDLRDHRHTWAVRAVRAGWPLELVARQLRHADGTLAVRVYARHVPKRREFDHWEQVATEHEAERLAAR